MKVTVKHDCGMRRSAELLDVVDAAAEEVYLRWPLGDLYAVSVATGRLVPTPEQNPIIQRWCLIGNGLGRAKQMLAERQQELAIPVAAEPSELALDRAKHLT